MTPYEEGVMVVGGFGGDRFTGRTFASGAVYSLERDEWESIPELPIPARWGHVASQVPGGVFVWGGSSEAEGAADLLDGAIFVEAEDRWEPISSPNERSHGPRLGAAAETVGERIVIGGGSARGTVSQQTLSVYDLPSGEWKSIPLARDFVDMLAPSGGTELLVLSVDEETVVLNWLDVGLLDVLASQSLGSANDIHSAVIVEASASEVGVLLVGHDRKASLVLVSRDTAGLVTISTSSQSNFGERLEGIGIRDRLQTRASQGDGMRVVASSEGTWVFDPVENRFALVDGECNPNSSLTSIEETLVVWGGQYCASTIELQAAQGYRIAIR